MADLSKRYTGSAAPDGNSYGMPNQLSYLTIYDQAGNEHQVGLTTSFDVEMDNGLQMKAYAFTKYREPSPNSPLWTVTLERDVIRGYSLPMMLKNMYQQGYKGVLNLDFQYMPFLLALDYDHAPPTLGAPSFFTADWAWYKVLIRNYREIFSRNGPQLIGESMTAYAMGEVYRQNGTTQYTSEKGAWGSTFFKTVKVTDGKENGGAVSSPVGWVTS